MSYKGIFNFYFYVKSSSSMIFISSDLTFWFERFLHVFFITDIRNLKTINIIILLKFIELNKELTFFPREITPPNPLKQNFQLEGRFVLNLKDMWNLPHQNIQPGLKKTNLLYK